MRLFNRTNNDLRPVNFERQFTRYAPGSVMVSMGNTKVLCTASIEEKVPSFLRDSGQGWLTAEYSMLPTSTHTRMRREIKKGREGGRTMEIQRLIGRSLRSVLDMTALGERAIYIDCDVIQADGGTRTASITGGMVALSDCVEKLLADGAISKNPIKEFVAAVSVGLIGDQAMLDLDYDEDFAADVDMNVVMTESGQFVEVQGTAEGQTFSRDELNALLDCASSGIHTLIANQKAATTSS